MKQKLIKGISSIFFAVTLGLICGFLLYKTYSKETKYLVSNNVVYLIEYKEYSNYDSMKLANLNNDYTYYKDKNTYYTVLGFSMDKNNLDKIKKIYKDVNIIKCYIDNKDFIDKLKNYDQELSKTNNKDKIKEILNNIISTYHNNEVEILKVYN